MAELCPIVFKASSRREPWLPHQCQKTLHAKHGPLISKYLPINQRHNFPSNGCWKLRRVHPDGFWIQGIFPEHFFIYFFFWAHPSSRGEVHGFCSCLPADEFVSRPAFQAQWTDPFILAMFLSCEFFVWGPTITRSYTSALLHHLVLIYNFLEVMQCNVPGGEKEAFLLFDMILSCLCNQSLLLSSEACQLRLDNVSEMNGHKPISLPSIFLTPPRNHPLTLTSPVTDRSLAGVSSPAWFFWLFLQWAHFRQGFENLDEWWC